MRRALILQHVPFEGPAAIGSTLEALGFHVEVRRLDQGDPVPSSIESGDVLVVMGGPMGVGDIGDPRFPFLEQEVRLLRRCFTEETPVLGVCLGAQLIAHAASTRVAPMIGSDGSRLFELGWAPVDLHLGELEDFLLRGLGERMTVFHWHGDQCDLPVGARLLASTQACPVQGFHLGRRIVGLQFHIEVGWEGIEALIHADEDFLEKVRGAEGPDLIRKETEQHATASSAERARLLRNILEFLAQD